MLKNISLEGKGFVHFVLKYIEGLPHGETINYCTIKSLLKSAQKLQYWLQNILN